MKFITHWFTIVLTMICLSTLRSDARTLSVGASGDATTFVSAATFSSTVDIDSDGVRLDSDNDGMLILLGLGNGFDEDLRLNLDDTTNTGVFTSTTGLATINFSSIALQESGIAVLNNDEIDASSELAAIMDDETGGTGVLVFGTSPVFTTDISIGTAGVRLSDDGDGALTIAGLGNGTDENLIFNFDDTANTVTVTTGTDVTTVNFSGIAVTSTACSSIESTEHNPTEAGATDDYVSLLIPGLGGSGFSATETDQDQFMVPVAMVARNLRAEVSAAPGVGNDAWVITLRDDAASSTLTCTIDEAATNCSDTTNAPALAAGSKLDILVISSGAGADPDAATTMNISFCLGQ